MAKQKKQQFEGIVYSTADNFDYISAASEEVQETKPASQQKLKVMLDKKARKGKIVTIVDGFVGSEDDLNDIAKKLKQKCGVGGASKDGSILIQGDFKNKIFEILKSEGYGVKLVGG
ncbi:translation initiation factor [Sphingobacterium oryzagri]|uniref:Translation initiation factor n=1 Tax=Sphingobacterium oryzagri TaxID=3025669 RepID=A0ABY7WFZ2_9SPHI|nr:translation initiation factor [Sphingobacterium sp. KACC 22765]WDF68542.1 translation initiation factor [Sphingobacterium sp. KACC 22765]